MPPPPGKAPGLKHLLQVQDEYVASSREIGTARSHD